MMIQSTQYVEDVFGQKTTSSGICLSYSSNYKYLPYLQKGLYTLNKNSPNCFAFVDLINCTSENNYKNTHIIISNIDAEGKPAVTKSLRTHNVKERVVSYTGAYANLKKVYNIYNILKLDKFEFVLNMDADNLILKDISNFDLLKEDFDILIRFTSEPLFGDELIARKNNFKDFDLSKINIESNDRCFREGCFVARNNDRTKEFFKYIQDNIFTNVAWFADSYWFLRAYQEFKDIIKIKKMPSNFVAYDIETELDGAWVCSGYGLNKHSEKYKELVKLL